MIVIGYPKSGNTWLCYLAAYALNVPYENLMEPGVHPRGAYERSLVKGGHSHRSFAGCVSGVFSSHDPKLLLDARRWRRKVYLLRDGRDVMTSFFFYRYRYLRLQRPSGGLEKVRSWAATALRALRLRSAPTLLQFVRENAAAWASHVQAGLHVVPPPDAIVRYEDLNADAPKALSSLFSQLGLDVQEAVIRDAVEHFRFDRLANRTMGTEKQDSFFRRGVVGDWREKFGREEREAFQRVAGRVLVAAGYESDASWVSEGV